MELAESRQMEKWKNHWEAIQENGYMITYLVNDEGSGMACAQKEFLSDIIRQPDTYHGIAHNIGLYVDRLEKAAYNAIGYEQERLTALKTGKRNSEKMRSQYGLAKHSAEEKIELYDNFHYLYLCLIRSLQVFDAKGNPNKRFESEHMLHAALELLEDLKIDGLKKEIRSIRNISSQLFSYLDEGENIRRELESFGIPNYILKEFYIALLRNQRTCIFSVRQNHTKFCYRGKYKFYNANVF
jgi:flagellin-specific chaperone FliS